ncbi:MAG TPA: hypothetical protein VKC61_07665 [Pyrinomonadaceae bacterium]|nr:hypothetical protein [Pyrinomonadaceae bacterium]
MSDGSGEIIIKGGSCEIYFDHDIFEAVENDPKRHKHATLSIKQITISGDSEFKDHDTGEHSDKFTGTVKIICR